jgi:molybdate transport system substrate-binding protein
MKNILISLTFVSALCTPAFADQLQVAVAANFVPPFREIANEFERTTGHTIQASSGSSGRFYAQIKNGAPFDVFFSADDERPKLLEDEGWAVKGSRFTYAIGRLVLWSPDSTFVTGPETLKTALFRHLAIANPKTAPYGLAAKQTMTKLGVWDSVQPRIVMGENLGQTIGFIDSGNAEVGFLALSQILDPKIKGKGSSWTVPSEYHEPIRQDAVLLTRAQNNPGAKALMEYMRGPGATATIKNYGYDLK